MVVMQGTKRLFSDKVVPFTISNNDTIVANIYGVTSYNDIADVPLSLTTFVITTQLSKVNINNLGVKNINNVSDIDFTDYSNYKPITLVYNSSLDKFVIENKSATGGSSTTEFYDVDSDKIKQLTDYAYAQYLLDPTVLNITLNQTDLFNIITKLEIDELYSSMQSNLNVRFFSETTGTGSLRTSKIEFPISQSYSGDNNDFNCTLEFYQLNITSPGTARTDIKQIYYKITFNGSTTNNYTCDIYVSPLATADDIGTNV